MADNITTETRSKIMRSIRSKSNLENLFCSKLWHRGLRFRRNVPSLFGKPDIAIKKYKFVVFIDSCFWHFCPRHGHFPKSNKEYWDKKIYRNVLRDYKVGNYYISKRWHVLRIWEHQIKDDLDRCVEYVIQYIEKIKEDQNAK
ncbi:very short patch repair endonuclease [Paenibacillus sp. MAH-36]|uniref:Very short patch repair endonuclease n=1 Tax=Paenibacillus violae TaxID=3077234 RepID=A0ABU3RNS3_9BACL|nr:very short patch repair endonuclease [Paenibacillus sp. PFR10]MDU0205814.1 very short patch repair endonuclease [Paenibacillus sp. PFR10]